MRPPFQMLLGLVVLALAAAFLSAPGRSAGAREAPPRDARYSPATDRPMPAALQAASFRWDGGITPQDRQVIEAAIAGARPEAQRLIAMVDGLTAMSVGSLSAAAGVTMPVPGGYQVILDLGPVAQQLGQRGISRLVLHELGHVIDAAILPAGLQASLDAGVPAGWGCDGGHSGACAVREERFAESFAKWAMNDIGVDLYIGYRVPPPGPSLDAWGEPLARLATGR